MREAPLRGQYARAMNGVILPKYCRWLAIHDLFSPSDARVWMAFAFIAALTAATCAVAIAGANERGIDDALLLTGRVSFIMFWLAYAGRSAARLFGQRFEPLKRQSRNFGLAFASAHVVHLGLVAWLCYIGASPPFSSFVTFGIAVFWTYLLAIVSIGRLQKAIGQRQWRLISFVGLNYIAIAFAFDFMRLHPDMSLRYLVGYLPFVVLAVAGFALRGCAWVASLVLVSGSGNLSR